MPRYALLLRAVNVGGIGRLPMADLRDLLTDLGCTNVATLLASGNAILDADHKPAALESLVQSALSDRLNLNTTIMARTAAEWTALIKANPLARQADRDPAKFAVMITSAAPDTAVLNTYLDAYAGPEQVIPGQHCLYLHYTDGMGRSKLKIPGKVATGTVRNWNTVRKIQRALDQ